MRRWRGVVALILGMAALAGPVWGQESTEDELTILIASPGEGETFYTAATGFRISMPIAGQVISYTGPLEPETVVLTIELLEADGSHSSTTVPLDDTGSFVAWASMLAPDLPWPSDDPHVEDTCGNCHRAKVNLAMPLDVTELVVTAQAADGRTGQVVRHLNFDRGDYRDLPVQIEGLPGTGETLQVRAETRIYDWRRRTFYATAVDGQATLSVEGLVHADLTYTVSAAPQIIAGTLYTTEASTVLVHGAGGGVDPVTLTALATRGALSGRLINSSTGAGLSAEVLAVNLTSGEGRTLESDADGAFVLDDLDIAEFVLHVRVAGYFHLPYRVDLAQGATADARIHLIPGGEATVHGTVTSGGQPVPFAEVTVAGHPATQVDPLTGQFVIDAVDVQTSSTVEIAAAGYYGLRLPEVRADLGSLELTLREDTEVLEYGEVRLYRPDTSVLRREAGVDILDRGVVWVEGGPDTGGTEIQLQAGDFMLASTGADYSVESLPGAQPRLYVRRGEVQAMALDSGAVRQVTAGQSLALDLAVRQPVDLVPGSGALLRASGGSVSVFQAAPTVTEQRNAAVKQVVVTIAQGVMLLAYLITLVILPLMAILLGARLVVRRLRN